MKKLLITFLMLASPVMAQETPTNKTPDVAYTMKLTTNNVDVTIKGKRLVFTDYSSKPASNCWRFAHNNVEIKAMPFFSASTMYTPYPVEICQTIEGVTNAIVKLHLVLTPEQQTELQGLVDQFGKDRDAKKTSGAVEITP